jgi:hypothetical protein
MHLPHVSRHVDSLVLRPPVAKALDSWFARLAKPNPLTHAEQWTASDGQDFISFGVHSMCPVNKQACISAEQNGGIWGQDGWRGASTGENTQLFLHSTTMEAAMLILGSGRILPSTGIAGVGIYCFMVKDMSRPSLLQAWNRGSLGGYNAGAGFVLKTGGILLNGSKDGLEILPSGCTAKKKDQYAVAWETGEVISVVFRSQALLSLLDRDLADSGYSAELHKALARVKDYIASRRDAPEAEVQGAMRLLANTIVNDPTVQQGRAEAQRRKREQHRGDDKDKDQAV